jgi:hypothetical protein
VAYFFGVAAQSVHELEVVEQEGLAKSPELEGALFVDARRGDFGYAQPGDEAVYALGFEGWELVLQLA